MSVALFQHINPKSGTKNGTQRPNNHRAKEILPSVLRLLELNTLFDADTPVSASTTDAGAFLKNPDAAAGFCDADGNALTGPMFYIREIPADRRAGAPTRLFVYLLDREDMCHASKTKTTLPWDEVRKLAKNHRPYVLASADVEASLENSNSS